MSDSNQPSQIENTEVKPQDSVRQRQISESISPTVSIPPVSIPIVVDPPPYIERWCPDAEYLDNITELGYSEVAAEKGLFYTGNISADAAVCWLLDNPQAVDDPTPLSLEGAAASSDSSSSDSTSGDNMFKMVLIVNCGLKMGLGKVAAQVGHATFGLYQKMISSPNFKASLLAWRSSGEITVVLRGDNEAHLKELQSHASMASCISFLVHDAGHTQVAAGSATVLAVFGGNSQIDSVIGNLIIL